MSEFIPIPVRDAFDADMRSDAERLWRSLPEPIAPAPDREAKARSWAAVQATMQTGDASVRRTPQRRAADRAPRTARRSSARRMPMWAGAFAAVALLAFVGFYLMNLDESASGIYTAGTTTQVVTLPDGTVVTLEPGATLTEGDWSTTRPLTLEGTAFFDVTRDESRPMHITTPNATVSVLGTSFTVTSDASETSVQVASGRVAVADAQGQKVAELLQGDAATLGANGPMIERAARSFDLNDVPLAQLAQEVGQAFGIAITLADDLADERITFAQRDVHTAESVLQTVAATKDLGYRETANGYELYRK